MDIKPWYLKDTEFSEILSSDDKMLFMHICPEKRFNRGEYIFRLGDPATDLHVIARGQVKLVQTTASGHDHILAILGQDDFMGEAFLKDESRYRVDAIALTDAATCPISRHQFIELSRQSPNFMLSFAEILTSHLFACREHLSYANDPIKIRIAKVLLDQARRFGQAINEHWYELQTELRHEELAAHISATRVSVTTVFAELRNDGFIEGTRGVYKLNITALESLTIK
jgi:CRP/FNR family transcriptional regulator, cyclic AMP receptor protein